MNIDPKQYNILRLYKELNQRYFGNKLPNDVSVTFGKVPKGVIGLTTANGIKRGVLTKEYVPGSGKITISPRPYDEQKLKGILLHEMIHLELLALSNDFKTNHEGLFLTKLRELQTRSGINIPLTHKADNEELQNLPQKEAGIMLLYKKDGSIKFSLFSVVCFNRDIHDIKARGQAILDYEGASVKRVEIGIFKSWLPSQYVVSQKYSYKNMKLYTLSDHGVLNNFKPLISIGYK